MLHTGPSLALSEGTVRVCTKRTLQPPPLMSLLCSPLPPYKNLYLHWDVETGLRQESSIFPGDGLWDMSPPSSRWPTNKPLSFISAPASPVLACKLADSQTCIRLHHFALAGMIYIFLENKIIFLNFHMPWWCNRRNYFFFSFIGLPTISLWVFSYSVHMLSLILAHYLSVHPLSQNKPNKI